MGTTSEPAPKKESFFDKLKKATDTIKQTVTDSVSKENLDKIKQTVKSQTESLSNTVSQNVNKLSDKIKETTQKTTDDKNQNDDDSSKNTPKR